MRLINVHSLELRWFAKDRPKYAIASHRWHEDETTYHEFLGKQNTDKYGFQKVIAFARYVRENLSTIAAVDWFWIDTCCINKESSAELQEAITSMFRWYREAALCITLLSDVTEVHDRKSLVKSVWFDRGWTLQELLAPRLVLFLTSRWQLVGHKGERPPLLKASGLEIGPNLHEDIAERTSIPREVLENYEKSLPMDVEVKRRWMLERDTTREEDKIYALFGILDVSLFINYGEGGRKAESRLLKELRTTEDVQAEPRSHGAASRQSSTDTERIRTWLKPLPSVELRDQLRECRADGTCSWVIELVEAKGWLKPETTSNIIWLHGGPGFGKSVTSAALVDHLEEVAGRPVAHFFCSASDESLRLPTNILRTCIAQLISQSTSLLRLANNLQNKSQSGVATEKDLHGLLCSLTNEGAGVVLIVDGFDECHEYESEHHKRCRLSRQRFLQQLFSAFVGTSSRLIMVSRDEDDLRSAFCTPGQDTLLEHVVDHGITTTDVHVDIQRFCYAQVDSNPRLSQQPDDLRNDVLDHLINGSDGMFLFASLQCALLAQAKNAAQLRRRMEDIPRDLDSFYEQYWQRIMDSDDLEQKRVLRILRWVTFAAEPLTVPALFEAIALQAQNGKLDISQEWLPMQNISERVARTDLLDACRPFLVLRRSNTTESFATTTVQLCHFSMKAFLAERLRIPEQKKLSATKDPILAELCVGYLAAGIPWKPLISTDPCLQSHPLLSYALFNLTQHFERDDSTFTSAHKLLLEFYDPANQNWIKWRDENERQTSKLHRHMSLNGRPGGRCYYAAAQGLDFVLDQLLADDADAINIVGGAYGTPLQVACSKGLVSTVTVLLRHSAAVNLTAGIHGTALHAAVAADVLAIVEALLTHEADASAMNASGRTALLEAVWREHWSIVPCLISASQHVDLACPFGNTPLSIAAQKGHQETIESLVKSGACVNPDSRLVNPLHAACRYAKVAAATLLLRLGANADSLDSKNRTPLIVAAESGNYAMTRVLLNAGASPHIVAADGWRALPLAAKNGHSKVVRALIDHRADFAATGPDGRTPFLLAVEHGLLETVQIFIDMKADPVALCSSKSSGVRLSTVYHKAASNDNLELVQAFLDAGLELAYTDSSGDTLLHSAAADGCLRTASGLLGRSADPTMKNQKDRCSLCGAAIGDHTAVVRLLLEHVSRHPDCEDLIGAALVAGAYANSIASVELLGDAAVALGIAHEKIQHAMVEAAGRGEIGIVRLLLARGACVALPDTSGRTSLCMAASRGEPRMVEFLLASGACPNRADRNGMTPLHIAAEAGHSVVVKVLLHGGSQTDRMAKGYLTPLGMAMQRKHVGIIRLLMDQGADAHIICETCDSRLLYYSRFRLVVVREIPLAERVGHTVQWRDQRGRSLIHLAAAQGRACCVEASVKLGISVNMADGQKRTPLHWAAHFGHELVVDQLVNLGADVSLTDQQHRLSADLAAISGYAALAASLNRLYRRKIRRRASVALETDAGEDCWPET